MKENLVYLVIWILLLLTPILSMMLRMANDTHLPFSWEEVIRSWRIFIPFLIVFLIHNYMIAPLLIYKKKRLLYVMLTVSILAIFQLYQCNSKPVPGHHRPNDIHFARHDGPDHPDDKFAPPTFNDSLSFPPPPPDMQSGPRHGDRRFGPPLLWGQHDIVSLIIIILMLGMNLGLKHYFKTSRDAVAMELLEKKNLEQQLEYLKYQINPHFFMNTLNNIHALVDIEPEEAKHSILELSKMMRYVLYEGAKGQVMLKKEIDCLNNYITLMKLRYTDKVLIDINISDPLIDKAVPPMLFITFVENAFKHGVSYRKESFIKVDISTTDDRVMFTCLNSKTDKEQDGDGGVGLANTRQRLDLIYGSDYSLCINDEADTYQVTLDIPFLTPEPNKA